MKDAAPREIRLADYEAPVFTTSDTRLHFDLRDGACEVTSILNVTRQVADGDSDLVLDGEHLDLVSVEVNGHTLGGNEYKVDDETLTLIDLPDEAEIKIVTRIEPEKNLALEGLYKSGSMYCTQCEAQGFRRITYYQDRPDVLARFTTSITADAAVYPNLLSNGNLVSDQVDGDRRTVTWEDPFPKPSYLFALVAGDLASLKDTFTTMSGRDVRLIIYSEPHNIGKCSYAMDALKRSMAWDEQAYGREYDLDIFMIVAVEDFNMGAMENKGLNIFNTSCVLASPDMATDAAHQRVEAVVAHEYFHNWSGNRVTCRDWFQLSLKEGFTVFRDAQFSSDMGSETVKRIEDVNFLRSVQFAEDSGPLAHPIRPSSYLEISNFYTTTVYEKGAEVVRMLHTLLGADGFRRGSDLYFDTHDGKAVTTEDFVLAMEAANGVDLSQFRLWYTQSGTPLLEVEQSIDGDDLILGQPTKEPFHIPVLIGLIDEAGETIQTEASSVASTSQIENRPEGILIQLKDASTQICFKGCSSAAVSFLRGFSAPVRVEYPRSVEVLQHLAKHDKNGFARWDVMQTLLVDEIMAMGEGKEISASMLELVRYLVIEATASDADAETRAVYASLLNLPDPGYVLEQIRPADVERVCDGLDRLKDALARELMLEFRKLYDTWASADAYTPEALSMGARALRNLALEYLCLIGEAAEVAALIDNHLGAADNLTDRSAALRAMCSSRTYPAVKRQKVLNEFYDEWQAGLYMPSSGTLTIDSFMQQMDQGIAFWPDESRISIRVILRLQLEWPRL
jgi:aminopeptidase N